MVSWGVNFPHKNVPIPLWLSPHMITSKSPPKSYKYDNYDKTIYKVSPLLLDSPGKPDRQALHYPTANFGPLSRGSVTNPINVNHCVWYFFDPMVTGSPGLNQDRSDSECSALTYFSMSLAHKYVNIKEPYNQDIKEQVTTTNWLKKKTGFTWNPQSQRHSVEMFFKFNPLFVVVLTFQIIYQ